MVSMLAGSVTQPRAERAGDDAGDDEACQRGQLDAGEDNREHAGQEERNADVVDERGQFLGRIGRRGYGNAKQGDREATGDLGTVHGRAAHPGGGAADFTANGRSVKAMSGRSGSSSPICGRGGDPASGASKITVSRPPPMLQSQGT